MRWKWRTLRVATSKPRCKAVAPIAKSSKAITIPWEACSPSMRPTLRAISTVTGCTGTSVHKWSMNPRDGACRHRFSCGTRRASIRRWLRPRGLNRSLRAWPLFVRGFAGQCDRAAPQQSRCWSRGMQEESHDRQAEPGNERGLPVPSAPASVKALRYALIADAAPVGRPCTNFGWRFESIVLYKWEIWESMESWLPTSAGTHWMSARMFIGSHRLQADCRR